MAKSSTKKTEKPVEELTYEEALAELEGIVEALEGEPGQLDEAIKLFERGQALVARCGVLLEEADLKVKKVVGDSVLLHDPKGGDDRFDWLQSETLIEDESGKLLVRDRFRIEGPQLGLAAADVPHFDVGAIVLEPDGDARLRAGVPIRVGDELAGQEEDQLDEIVRAFPTPQRGGDESARARRARRDRGKNRRKLVCALVASLSEAPGAACRRGHVLASDRSRSKLLVSRRETCI